MKILGISGSPRKEDQSGTYTLVKTVLENSGCDYELISLRGKRIAGCIACLGCVKDNVCKVDDDMAALLAPYSGHRHRVVRMVELAGVAPPRRGPRMRLPGPR